MKLSMREISELREERQIGLFEAREIVKGRELQRMTEAARTVEDLRAVLLDLINEGYPS